MGAFRERRLRRELQLAQLEAMGTVRGLFKRPGNPGYNPDADAPWKEVRGVTRAALMLAQGAMAAERAKVTADAGPRVLGVVVVPARVESRTEWEALATQVVERPAIEAVVAEDDKREDPPTLEKP